MLFTSYNSNYRVPRNFWSAHLASSYAELTVHSYIADALLSWQVRLHPVQACAVIMVCAVLHSLATAVGETDPDDEVYPVENDDGDSV